MVFQERMLHGEPTEAKGEEILKHGKNIFPLAMLMTDENSVRWQTMYHYVKSGFPQHQGNSSRNPSVAIHSLAVFYKSHHVVQTSPASSTLSLGCYGWKGWQALLSTGGCWRPSRSFQSIPICQTIRPPRHSRQRCVAGHKPYPIMTQKSKLVTPAVVFNILNAELSSLATSFALSLNAGSALVENPSNLFVESFKTAPVLHVQDSSVPNAILVRLWVQTFIQKVQDMRRMQNGSKPSIQMVYEACLRAQRPERMPTLPVEPET
ncbi:uncharacterized protein TNCV_1230351 [Trichonephila clavipes]|nr:uncharacterized protein TNCV_1230351 [Trichonephila clavipes]